MGARVRGVAVVVVVLAVGAFLGSAVQQWLQAPGGSPRRRSPPVPEAGGERVRVEVRNGGGRSGMAHEATELLRDRGFDVVFYGNARAFDRQTSMVLDRVGRPEMARSVADALHIPVVRTEPDSNLYLDVSVVLGQDWEPPATQPEPVATPAWWDLRRFFRDHPRPEGTDPRGRMVDPGEGGGA
ncbi:MAG TPA: LytR C-terminal domain-containing protein [Longimicrobiales bacterium]|nr:LytR C-terminal domain-containing protein [Longimicrobiales bacterium]